LDRGVNFSGDFSSGGKRENPFVYVASMKIGAPVSCRQNFEIQIAPTTTRGEWKPSFPGKRFVESFISSSWKNEEKYAGNIVLAAALFSYLDEVGTGMFESRVT
jgi:hypothetical protein